MKLLDVPAEVHPLAVKYLRIYLTGMPVILLYNFESAIFRSCGNTRTPLAALVISGILNVIYLFSFVQKGLSGYLRGFGVSFIPAACAVIGICGVRLTWIFTVFQRSPSFTTIMQVYPLSLGITAAVILVVTMIVKPSRRYFVRDDTQPNVFNGTLLTKQKT